MFSCLLDPPVGICPSGQPVAAPSSTDFCRQSLHGWGPAGLTVVPGVRGLRVHPCGFFSRHRGRQHPRVSQQPELFPPSLVPLNAGGPRAAGGACSVLRFCLHRPVDSAPPHPHQAPGQGGALLRLSDSVDFPWFGSLGGRKRARHPVSHPASQTAVTQFRVRY